MKWCPRQWAQLRWQGLKQQLRQVLFPMKLELLEREEFQQVRSEDVTMELLLGRVNWMQRMN
jgi:hypothetical protein